MPVLICPICGAENPISGDKCLKCNASLDGVIPLETPVDRISEDEDLEVLSKDQQDLPGLLQSLKNDGDIGEMDGSLKDNLDPNGDLSDIFAEEKTPEAEEVPDWLERIRKRAKEEPDAIGDVTQKISAALDTISDDKGESKHDDFQSWIDNIRKPGGTPSVEQPAEEIKDEQPTSRISDEDWLMKIRKAEGKLPEGPDPSEQKGDSLLQWLIDIEEGREAPSKIEDDSLEPGEDDDVEFSSSLAKGLVVNEQTQKIATPINESFQIDRLMVDISDEEQEQVNLLEAVVNQENQALQRHEPLRKQKHWLWRLFITLIIISSITTSLLAWDNAEISDASLSPQAAAFLTWSDSVQPGASLLFILDFQPGYFNEMMQVSKPVLSKMIGKEINISILSTNPSGELLFERLLADISETELNITNLGYLPMGSLAAFGLSNHPEGEILPIPESPVALQTTGYDGVLILSDQAEDVQIWVEQLTALTPEPPILLLLTAQAGPLSLPYWQSGQVNGMIAGVVEAAAFEAEVSGQAVSHSGIRAYQLGIGLMIVMLLLGLTMKKDGSKGGVG